MKEFESLAAGDPVQTHSAFLLLQFPKKPHFHVSNPPRRDTSAERFLVHIFLNIYSLEVLTIS